MKTNRRGKTNDALYRRADAPVEARVAGCAEHRALALEAARRSIVLLKNECGVLPLAKGRTLAVIGPNAAIGRLGNYSTLHASAVSPLDGMRRRAGRRVKILHAEGCEINGQSRDGFRVKADVVVKRQLV